MTLISVLHKFCGSQLATVSHVAEVENQSGRYANVILGRTEGSTPEVVRLYHTNGDPRTEVPIETTTATVGFSDALEMIRGWLHDVDAVLCLAEKAVDEEPGLVTAQGVLRPDQEIVHTQFRTIMPTGVEHHAKPHFDVANALRIPPVQIGIIRIAEGLGIEALVGKAAEDVEPGSLLGGGETGGQDHERKQGKNENADFPSCALQCDSHSYESADSLSEIVLSCEASTNIAGRRGPRLCGVGCWTASIHSLRVENVLRLVSQPRWDLLFSHGSD